MAEVVLNDECMRCKDKECHDGENFCNYAMQKNSFYKNPRLYKGLEVIRLPTYKELEKENAELKKKLESAEFGFNKANEWHKVSEKLPEMDVLVYLWNKIDDFPVVARRHIPYGQKKWLWDCKWGSGFTISQLIGEDYLWKEIVLPELPKEKI